MRLGIVVNRFGTLSPRYTTIHLAFEAMALQCAVVLLDVDSFEQRPDGSIWARVRYLAPGKARSREQFVRALQHTSEHLADKIDLATLDVLFLRNNPFNADVLSFACRLKRLGVLVVNDPDTLLGATSKLYMSGFPASVQPRTLVSKDHQEIKNFLAELDSPAILKPLKGYGGEHILYVRRRQKMNLNAYLEALGKVNGGYIVAQEYIRAAKQGDKRILLLAGEIIGVYNRLHAQDDFRNNIHSGGRPRYSSVTPEDRRLCALLTPRLEEDEIYLAGVDKIGDKILEVNVFAPGGVNNINALTGSNLGRSIVQDLQRRVACSGLGRKRVRAAAGA